MGTCSSCGATERRISKALALCAACIRTQPQVALQSGRRAQARSRRRWQLAPRPPRARDGVACAQCVNGCRIPEGESGYCGLRQNADGRLLGAGPQRGKLSWYHHPLPTNCVGHWVCAGGTGCR